LLGRALAKMNFGPVQQNIRNLDIGFTPDLP
jgi:hypothetical protein